MRQAEIKIPSELFAPAESSSFEGTLDLPELQVGPDDYLFAHPVEWKVDITNTGAALLVMGTATATATCACARCLEDVVFDFEGDIESYLLIEAAGAEGLEDDEDAPGEDEFEVLPADHIVDLEPMIRAALMVDAPWQPLCEEGCKGLCPNCGANLNEGPCGCGGDESLRDYENAANPFAALANFKFE